MLHQVKTKNHLRGREALRFNKVHIRKCEHNGKPTDVLEVFYSIWGDKWIAQVKDFIEENRKNIIRDLRSKIKIAYQNGHN